MRKFCYKCGALEDEKGPLIDGLCRECFLQENALVKLPEKLELEFCDMCGAYFLGGEKRELSGDPKVEYIEAAKELVSLEMEVLQKGPAGLRYFGFDESKGVDVGFEAEYISPETIRVDLEVQAKFFESQDEPLTERAQVEVELLKKRCEVCKKINSGYYEAVLQIRGEGELSEERISGIVSAIDEDFWRDQDRPEDEFVSKVKRKHGGLNLYASSSRLAEDMARFLKDRYGAKMGKSSELIGQTEDGRDRYRVTVVARMPF